MSTPSQPRPRPRYLLLLVLTIAAGLGSRRFPELLPAFVARYAGDMLWATMVFWFLALGWRSAATWRLAVAAAAIAWAVEASQLYHAPWIDGVRGTLVGALVLGSGFLWSDLVCYTAGAGLAALVDHHLERRRP